MRYLASIIVQLNLLQYAWISNDVVSCARQAKGINKNNTDFILVFVYVVLYECDCISHLTHFVYTHHSGDKEHTMCSYVVSFLVIHGISPPKIIPHFIRDSDNMSRMCCLLVFHIRHRNFANIEASRYSLSVFLPPCEAVFLFSCFPTVYESNKQ